MHILRSTFLFWNSTGIYLHDVQFEKPLITYHHLFFLLYSENINFSNASIHF